MEGYYNIDSGTLNPYRHGEVFVLDDGMETDMDLGTYERLLDQDLTRDNYVTSGQIFRRVLDKERHGEYLGRDVQMIPHVTGEVKYLLRELAVKQSADVVFVEVGGTVGDYENAFYIEAARELAFEEGEQSVCFVALTYIIEPKALGEQKSKAAQLGLKKLMEAGIQPHIVACRAQNVVGNTVLQKIAMFSNVPIKRVFSMHDRKSIYTMPEAMREGGLDREILGLLDLHEQVNVVHEDHARERWRGFVELLTAKRRYRARIGITGKYAALARRLRLDRQGALEHLQRLHLSVDLAGGLDRHHGHEAKARKNPKPRHDLEGLNAVDRARRLPAWAARRARSPACAIAARTPCSYLGLCLGFQTAVIESAPAMFAV